MYRRFSVICTIILFLLSGVTTNLIAQELHTYTDRDSVRVGDVINFTLVLNTSEEYGSANFPDESHFDENDIILVNRERHRISAMRDSVVYTLQNFSTEDYQIPRLPVELTGGAYGDTTLYSTPVPVFFKSIVAEGDDEFRPLKPIFDFAAAFWIWIIAALIFILMGWLIYRYLQNREIKEPQPIEEFIPEPFINPMDKLEKDLHTLSGSDSPLNHKDFKEFYVLLGDAIRRYFEDVYDIDALEMTSGEILRHLRVYPANKEVIKITRKVLNEADMVKFAKFEPDIPQAKKALNIAFQFVNVVSEVDKSRIETLRKLHEQKEQIRQEEIEQ
jgi:hypothetical protein